MAFLHRPVLFEECIDGLNIKPDGIYVDATFGRGGHSAGILERLSNGGRLLCFDRDIRAQEDRRDFFADRRTTFIHSNFRYIDSELDGLGIEKVNGILFDLGVSSPQLDDSDRGFSYTQDAPLDMRMDQSNVLTAYEVINTWPEDEIRRILIDYGEERFAARIAGNIVKNRTEKPIETTTELVDIIKRSLPAASLREKQHPAKRSFQAIRIAVNDELASLEEALGKAIDRLAPEGRICVISFHSLEDRIVKTIFNKRAEGCICPRDFPVCVCGRKPEISLLTRKPITPQAKEEEENPRSRSAKLRIAQKL